MFKNQTVIVTGGAKNIGKAIAEEFFSQQANVVVNDLFPEEKSEIKKEVLLSNRLLYSQGDITSLVHQEKLIEETLNRFSKIDILINNVGRGSGKGLFDIDPTTMKKSIETNLIAPFFLTQKIVKQMIGQQIKGSVIFISSIHRTIPCGNIDYSSSKRALEMIIKELALDLGIYGIRVNGIAPGKITPTKNWDKRIPLKNMSGIPRDIANAVLFLANDSSSSYITGEILVVDGGLSLAFER